MEIGKMLKDFLVNNTRCLTQLSIRKARSLAYLIANRWLPNIFLPILALPAVIPFRLFASFYNVRLVRLHSFKLGHLAANTDRLVSGLKKTGERRNLILFCDHKDVSNSYLIKKWAELYPVGPRWLCRPLFLANRFLPGGSAFEIDLRHSSDRDVEGLHEDLPPNILFSNDEHLVAEAILKPLLGNRPVVCIICRDSGYYDTRVGNNADKRDSYRNSDINSFLPAIEWLVSKGYIIFRMGRDSNSSLDIDSPFVIDYANSDFQSDFLDLYLASICRFTISTSTGWDALAKLFRKPVLFVNFCPVGYAPSYTKRDIFAFKHHRFVGKRRMLSLSEVLDTGAANSLSTEGFERVGVELSSMTEAEIKDAVIDMHKFVLSGCALEDNKDRQNCEIFWDVFFSRNEQILSFWDLHGKPRSSPVPSYIKKHSHWLV